MSQSSNDKSTAGGNKVDRWIGLTAGIAGILSFIQGLLSGKAVFVVVPLLILVGLVVFTASRREWRMLAIILGVMVATMATLIGLYVVNFGALPLINKAPSVVSGQSASSSPSATPTNSASSASSNTKTLYKGNVTLAPNQAVDLDASSPKTADSQSSAASPYDLYYLAPRPDGTGASLQGVNGVYNVSVGFNPTQAYYACNQALGPNSTAHPTSGGSSMFAGSDAICFETSDHHLGWASVESMQSNTYQAQLSILIWNQTVPQN